MVFKTLNTSFPNMINAGISYGQKQKILQLFFVIFCVPEVKKLTLTLFFEAIDLSDFFVFLH